MQLSMLEKTIALYFQTIKSNRDFDIQIALKDHYWMQLWPCVWSMIHNNLHTVIFNGKNPTKQTATLCYLAGISCLLLFLTEDSDHQKSQCKIEKGMPFHFQISKISKVKTSLVGLQPYCFLLLYLFWWINHITEIFIDQFATFMVKYP